MHKRSDGADEEILLPDLPIIDAHHHLFDRDSGQYLIDECHQDMTSGHRIVASVYIEARSNDRPRGSGLMEPLAEIDYANQMADLSARGDYGPVQIAAAIVGYADLNAGAVIGELLDRALEVAPTRLRGVRQAAITVPQPPVRQMPPQPASEGLLAGESFRAGFAQAVARGLSFEAAIFSHQMAGVAALADAFPEATIVLDHMAPAVSSNDPAERQAAFGLWQAGLVDLARRPNVVCKVGGLGMRYWGFGLEKRTDVVGSRELAALWAPYVHTAVEAFGADRCMMESNYPVDGITCGYVPLWNALKLTVAGASRGELDSLFHGTASRVYRLPAPDFSAF